MICDCGAAMASARDYSGVYWRCLECAAREAGVAMSNPTCDCGAAGERDMLAAQLKVLQRQVRILFSREAAESAIKEFLDAQNDRPFGVGNE